MAESSVEEQENEKVFSVAPYEMGAEERLSQAIQELKKIKDQEEWPQIPSGKEVKPGKRDSRISLLRERLLLSGDLDTGRSSDSDYFDSDLVRALIHFQRRYGLYDNGILGPESLAALNMSVDKQISKAEENLKRLRALSFALTDRYLLVNIPDFRLQLVENGKVIMTMKVVLGRTDRPSPTLDATMTHVVFSPHWHIPRSIAIHDKLPLLMKDPYYLQQQGMRLYDDQMVEVDPLSIDWQGVSADNFPYRIVQDPGDLNSLGHVKFVFPNRNNVYMHDTPDKHLFQYAVRAFSSGCFRIEKPVDLAEYLLSDDSTWDRMAIIDAIEAGQQQEIGLKNPIPIHVTYITAWVDDQNQLQLRPDVYKYDGDAEVAENRPVEHEN